MKKLKTALRITLNTLFTLYTFWHIGFIYILLYILQNYVLYGLLQDTTEMAVFFFGGIAWVMTVFSLIIAGVCFTFRKKSFGIIYSVVFAAGMCVFLIFTCFDSIAVLPNMPEWYSYLILSVLNIERLPYPSLFISVALIAIVSLIILYVVVSHIVKHQKE